MDLGIKGRKALVNGGVTNSTLQGSSHARPFDQPNTRRYR
jgi:hypothetical protein